MKISDMTSWHELFSLIAPVQPKLHRVSYSNETIPNAPKHYETHQKMSLLSNGLDQERSLEKCLTRLRGTNFFINYTSSAQIAPSFAKLRNGPKCTQTIRNSPKHEFRVQCSGPSAFVVKMFDMSSCHELFSLIAQVSAQNATSFVQ